MFRQCRALLQLGFNTTASTRLTLAEAREKYHTLRQRPDAQPVKLIETELAYIHLLGQTGREADLKECLRIGDEVWARIEAEQGQTPNGQSPTKGLSLHLCTSMRHSAKKLGDVARASLWVRRLGQLHGSYFNPFAESNGSGATATGDEKIDGKPKLGANIRKFELDERGVRKNVKWNGPTGVHHTFNTTRHPMTDLPFMRAMQGYTPHPDSGTKY